MTRQSKGTYSFCTPALSRCKSSRRQRVLTLYVIQECIDSLKVILTYLWTSFSYTVMLLFLTTVMHMVNLCDKIS